MRIVYRVNIEDKIILIEAIGPRGMFINNHNKRAITDVVVQYESRIMERWHPIVRYDCSHGFFHRDILTPKGEASKQAIPIQNLKDALTYAEQDIKDRWEWYKERFKKGMKK
ncbi:MAG: hypothetical protein QMD01_05190 [Thermodesulfovibrionales bacterium]|nr:hypothetical protein [Thermodesulfovibrionales bacterium]